MGRKIRVAVVDDEPLARRRLVRFLKGQPDVDVVGAFSSGESVAALKRLAPDVLFLDVLMPGRGGFELFSALGAGVPPKVVFVTAFSEHAVRAFDIGAVDYLLKPFDAQRFETAFARVRADLEREPEECARRLISRVETLLDRERQRRRGTAEPADRILVRDGRRTYLLRTSEIDWIEAADNYVRVHAGKTIHLIRRTLSSMGAELDGARFVRIHRCTIVNLDHVREIHHGTEGDHQMVLRDGTRLRLSERCRRRLERRVQSLAM